MDSCFWTGIVNSFNRLIDNHKGSKGSNCVAILLSCPVCLALYALPCIYYERGSHAFLYEHWKGIGLNFSLKSQILER